MSSLRSGLKTARGNIVFIIGLLLAFTIVINLEKMDTGEFELVKTDKISITNDKSINDSYRPLTADEREWAKIAWSYFENNTIEETGLVNSVDGYQASTLWDTSSYILGLISAAKLEIIEFEEFDRRVRKVLETFSVIPLFDDQLPNKSYNTSSVEMVTYTNRSTQRGIGWSAIDIGRVMVPLNILVWQYPAYTPLVNNILNHWQLSKVIRDAEMVGTDLDDLGNTIYLQEGRLGYEEYAAKSLSLIGLDVSTALNYEEFLKFHNIYDIEVGVDIRSPDRFGALNYVVSEPYILDGVEYGFDEKSKELAKRIYRVQHARYVETGQLTAVSEDNIDRPPYFVYNTIYADGKKWNAVTEAGEDASEFRSISTKTVFGLHALFDTDYTQELMDTITNNHDPERGWYSGIYETSGEPNRALTANTNGIILEALHYIQEGPLLSIHQSSGHVAALSE